ncbi:hypothetical protein KUW19_00895 [Ferrimonas balearica]|uniref:hypothetical protein n=1 Tax=Ferrimonas balearica TaxID=44012 RepID=UPI001C98239F|nr:hypothetical protein [Ferrimonas balearica]MBY6105034.1 hypothetical protein [Ferrimonas balearica]
MNVDFLAGQTYKPGATAGGAANGNSFEYQTWSPTGQNAFGWTNSQYGVGNYTGDKAAQKTYADLTRAQWEDYKKRFLPVQKDYMDAVTSGKMLDEQLGRITTNVDNAFSSAAQAQQINQQRYGIKTNSTQDAASARSNAFAQSAATAQAMNTTRQGAEDTMNAFMEGSGARNAVINANQGG